MSLGPLVDFLVFIGPPLDVAPVSGRGAVGAEGELEFLALLTPGVLVALLVLAAVLAFVGWRVWRRVTSALRAASPTRMGLERRGLQLRAAALPPGTLRQILQLRASLHDQLTFTERVVVESPGRAGVLSDLLADLRGSADELDRRLRLMQYEPAEDYRQQALPQLAERVQQFNDNALSLRRSAVDLTCDPTFVQLREQQLRDRIAGLAAAVEELREQGFPIAVTHQSPSPDTDRKQRP